MAEDLKALEAEFDKCLETVRSKRGTTEELRAMNRMLAIRKLVKAEYARLMDKMNEDIAKPHGK